MFELFVQLDPNLQKFVEVGVMFVVSYLLLQISNVFPWLAEYLGQYKNGIVVWLTGLVVQLLQAQLNRIPVEWDNVVLLAMKLLVEVIVVLTGFGLFKRFRWAGHKAL